MSPNKSGANSSVPAEQLIEFNRSINDETQRQANFFKNFVKEFSEESPLRWWIIGAGVGGAVELLRLGWDILKYFGIVH